MSQPLASDQARVCFTRALDFAEPAINPDYVVDCGSNIEFDAKIERCPSYKQSLANSYDPAGAIYFETPPEVKHQRQLGPAQGNWVWYLETPVLIGPGDPKQDIPPNARFAGSVGPGRSLVFDRAPGTMRLIVIMDAGGQKGSEAFAPEFQVEAGRMYDVSYSCSGFGSITVHFSITERK